MSLTVALDTIRPEQLGRNQEIITGTITFDSSYPTGGEADTGISKYFHTLQSLQFETDGTYLAVWDKTNSKVKMFTALTTEVGNGVDLSSVSLRFCAVGLA